VLHRQHCYGLCLVVPLCSLVHITCVLAHVSGFSCHTLGNIGVSSIEHRAIISLKSAMFEHFCWQLRRDISINGVADQIIASFMLLPSLNCLEARWAALLVLLSLVCVDCRRSNLINVGWELVRESVSLLNDGHGYGSILMLTNVIVFLVLLVVPFILNQDFIVLFT